MMKNKAFKNVKPKKTFLFKIKKHKKFYSNSFTTVH